jgi:hypothetical protein
MFSHLLFTVGALCAFLLAATMGISSARGFVLMLMGAVLSWAPDWMRGLSWAATVGALYMLVLRVCADPCIRNSGPERGRREREVAGSMNRREREEPTAIRKWIGDVSAERVGQTWRAEDHEALIRMMHATDELAEALVASARRHAEKGAFEKSEMEDFDGVRATIKPVGLETQTRGD